MVKASTRQAALTRARQRRIELDRDRDARDRRVEKEVAEALVLLDRRADLERDLAGVTASLAQTLRTLVQDVNLEQAATLCGVDLRQARRLTRTPAAAVVRAADTPRAVSRSGAPGPQ